MQCGIVGYDHCVLWDNHRLGTEYQGLRTRGVGLDNCNGGEETYCFELARFCQIAFTPDGGESITTTAKQRGRRGNMAS